MEVDRTVHQNVMTATMVCCKAVDQLYHHLLNRCSLQFEDFASLGNIYKYV